jgi:hypothetical protein
MSDRRPLHKLSSLLFYDMLEMRELMKKRIVSKFREEGAETGEILDMIESFMNIQSVLGEEVKGRLRGLATYEMFQGEYKKRKG